MSKTFMAFLGLMAGVLLLSSCEKTCTCDVIIGGEVKYPMEQTLDKEQHKACKDISYTQWKDGLEYGQKCK
ncbi:MAG: hypothetical protein LBV46_03825 [Bacteroidales bacterium]|jgi:S-adenosylmethionine synthetase|nr:hypothetical protein [Bacteroidales bacterium]